MSDTKVCKKCNTDKTLEEFASRKDRPTKIRTYCKECDNKRRQKLYKENIELERRSALERYFLNREFNISKARKNHLKRRYNITEIQYLDLLEKQNYCCAICFGQSKNKKLDVDHDHVTGEIRGLLCNKCNRYLISNRTDPEIFRKASIYLTGPFTGLFVSGETDENLHSSS